MQTAGRFHRRLRRVLNAIVYHWERNFIESHGRLLPFSIFGFYLSLSLSLSFHRWKVENRFAKYFRARRERRDTILRRIQKRSKETIIGTQRFLLITVRNST